MFKPHFALFLVLGVCVTSCQTNNKVAPQLTFEAAQGHLSQPNNAPENSVQKDQSVLTIPTKSTSRSKSPISLPTNLSMPSPSGEFISTSWKTFKDDSIFERYLNRKPITFTVGGLTRKDLDQLQALDMMKALTEATLSQNNGLYITKSFIAGKDPNELIGPYGKLGNYNSGGDNSNAFIDRPNDSKLNPVFVDALRIHTDTTVDQMVKFANDGDLGAIRRVYFQARIPLYFWLYNSKVDQDKVVKIFDLLRSVGLYDNTSTTFKSLILDQINQMGAGGIAKSDGQPIGVPVLIEHMVKQRETLKTKAQLLDHFVKIGAFGNNHIFTAIGGERVDFEEMEEELIRYFLARTTYFSDNGPMGEFKAAKNASWLSKAHNTAVEGALQDALRRASKAPKLPTDFAKLEQEKKALLDEQARIFELE
jgi:hypothetical protein